MRVAAMLLQVAKSFNVWMSGLQTDMQRRSLDPSLTDQHIPFLTRACLFISQMFLQHRLPLEAPAMNPMFT